DIVAHLDIEDADELLIRAIDGDASGPDLLPENGERMVGEWIDIGDRRIAHGYLSEAGVRVHVLRFSDRYCHHIGAVATANPNNVRGVRLPREAKQQRG